MDSKELLTSTRAQFMRAFLAAVRSTIPKVKEDLFQRADASYTSADQARLLYSRNVLVEKNELVIEHLYAGMDRLVNRSFQTTYNTFHKPSALDANADKLSLVDSSAFEDELRINEVTARFRTEGEEQLRDLNIRIALMFGQDNIKERENPFRPYLFTRCIASAFEGLGVSGELAGTLTELFSDSFAGSVSDIYRAVNVHLAENGVAAQLQLKIQKSPTAPGTQGSGSVSHAESGDQQSFGGGRVQAVGDGSAAVAPRPRHNVESLFAAVRGIAGGLGRIAPLTRVAEPAHEGADGGGDGGYGSGGSGGGSGSGSGSGGGGSGGNGGGHGNAGGPSGHAGDGKPGWLSGNQAVGNVLRKFLSRGAAPPEAGAHAHEHGDALPYYSASHATQTGGRMPGTAPAHPTQLVQSVRVLQHTRTPDTEQMLDEQGEVRNLILEQRGPLSEASKDIDEQMTIDIVAMLFEFILRDNQVPAEVRAQLGRLQFIVLKVALRDTTLLTQKGHPARMLVNRIGSISVGLKQIDPTGAHITAEICRIVDRLLEDEEEDAALFSKMLDEFDAFIAVELRVSDKGVEKAIGAVEQVQNRALRFAHTTAHLGEALHGLMIDPYLKGFLENSWVNAIEVAAWDNAERAQRLRLLVPDLLWSILPKLTAAQRGQLFGMLPTLLKSLREGLTLTEMNAAAQQQLMDWLVAAHTSALRTGHSVSEPLSLESIHAHFRHFVVNPEDGGKHAIDYSNLPNNHQLINLAIKALDLEVKMLDQVFQENFPEGSDEPEGVTALTPELVRERLRSGITIEINLGANKNQGRLNWVDPKLSNLVLSLEGSNAPSMISVSMFLRLVKRGQVRFLEEEPLFERAVESLLESADGLDKAA
jgi:hypothetical protein